MAEATQASTPVPVTAATTATADPQALVPIATDLSVVERKQTTHQKAAARADAAIAKAVEADKAKVEKPADAKPRADEANPAEAAKSDEAKAEGEPKKDEVAEKAKAEAEAKAKADEATKNEPRLSRAMAILAERERTLASREKALTGKLEEQRRAFEAEKQAFTTERARDTEDLTFVRKVREAMQQQGRVAAAKMFGFTIEELAEAKSREVEPSPADIAAQETRRILQEQEAAREKAAKEAADAEKAKKTAEAEKVAAEDYAKGYDFASRALDLHNADPSKRPYLAATPFNGQQIWDAAKELTKQTGREMTPAEVLDEAEKVLAARYSPINRPQVTPPPPAPPPPPAAKTEEPKKEPKQEAKKPPAEQPRKRYQKRETPMDRAAAALRSRGL
jgi:colicin import membrane protein